MKYPSCPQEYNQRGSIHIFYYYHYPCKCIPHTTHNLPYFTIYIFIILRPICSPPEMEIPSVFQRIKVSQQPARHHMRPNLVLLGEMVRLHGMNSLIKKKQ